ncbi:MAG TPA: hypothetical protein VJA94_04465 [Candidatus Angelobacter sp.]
MFPRYIAVVLLAFALTSIGICVPKSHSKPTSGIKGKVALTGNCPGPQRIGESCPPRPYEGKLAIRNASDQQVVTTTTTDSKGEFRVAVPPGKYVITQSPETRYPLIHSPEVVVEKNKFTTVQIQGDLGMR